VTTVKIILYADKAKQGTRIWGFYTSSYEMWESIVGLWRWRFTTHTQGCEDVYDLCSSK